MQAKLLIAVLNAVILGNRERICAATPAATTHVSGLVAIAAIADLAEAARPLNAVDSPVVAAA